MAMKKTNKLVQWYKKKVKRQGHKNWPTVEASLINAYLIVKITQCCFLPLLTNRSCIKVKVTERSLSMPCISLPSCQVWMPQLKYIFQDSSGSARAWAVCSDLNSRHPDMTFAADWALKTNYLSIYLNYYCYVDSATVCHLSRQRQKYCLMSCLNFWRAWITSFMLTLIRFFPKHARYNLHAGTKSQTLPYY